MLIAFNKPFRVLCQFSSDGEKRTLANYIDVPAVYPAGRLDYDSEGLVLLTDDGLLQARLSAPASRIAKTYLVQVEGRADDGQLSRLAAGVILDGKKTLPAGVRRVLPPDDLWPREPPIRFRQAIPTEWLELTLHEGRNRQVRRMTAAVGLPTLRLVRRAIGNLDLFRLALAPGCLSPIDPASVAANLLQKRTPKTPFTRGR